MAQKKDVIWILCIYKYVEQMTVCPWFILLLLLVILLVLEYCRTSLLLTAQTLIHHFMELLFVMLIQTI